MLCFPSDLRDSRSLPGEHSSSPIPKGSCLTRQAMRRSIAVFSVLLVVGTSPAIAQLANCPAGAWANRHLAGHVANYVNKHGRDCRIFSPILGMPRDLSVYLPPGYDAGRTYPL